MKNSQDSTSISSENGASKLDPQHLAAKLDAELDDFISGLEKKAYTEGWPQDRWEEEMEKHPFFMTKAPEPGEQLSPLMEGIQQLKYDETVNSPEDLAKAYKDDGNFNFKYKKYRYAILAYTEGLKTQCNDNELNSQLLNNRAASNYFLKNYRLSLSDCIAAIKLKPNYKKAAFRAAQCCFHLKRHGECVTHCNYVLKIEPNDKEAQDLKTRSLNSMKIADRDARKETAVRKKEEIETLSIIQAITERKIRFQGQGRSALDLSDLEPTVPLAAGARVHFVDKGLLAWPVLFLYPEYKLTECIKEFYENSTFDSVLNMVFEELPEWDKEGKYRPEKVKVYFEDEDARFHCIPGHNTLLMALNHPRYIVKGGTPSFMVFASGSAAEAQYVHKR